MVVFFVSSFNSTGISYLVRRHCGTYYWHRWIAGKSRRGSLKTKSLSVAKTRLPLALDRAGVRFEKRALAGGDELKTVGDWIGEWIRRHKLRPRLKQSTKDHDEKLARLLLEEDFVKHDLKRIPAGVIDSWWVGFCDRCEAVTVNARLRVLKAAMKLAVKEGAVGVSPVEELERKKKVRKILEIPSPEDLRLLIDSIRDQGRRYSDEVASMVELGMLSGLRPAELAAVAGEDFRDGFLVVRGDSSSTKNLREREVPMIPALAELLNEKGWGEVSGRLFSVSSPRRAMRAACDRLGIRPVKPYDLRHFFITKCIEAGVDVPTVALWAGHQDGGALIMSTYTHVTRKHSARVADRVRF